MHEVLDKLEKQLTTELKKIVDKNDMSPAELDNAKKAVCLMKEIQEVKMGKSEMTMGMSESSYRNRYSNGGYGTIRYEGEHNMGRYDSRYDGRNSYEEGRSGHSIKDRMIDQLERMMDEAKSEYERQEISDEIRRLSMEK